MARFAVALAALSLLVTVALAAVVVAPDRQPRVTAEQMQSVVQRLDRIGGELEQLRQAQQEHAKALAAADPAGQAIAAVREEVATLRQDVERLRAGPAPARPGSRPKRQ